MNWIGQHIVSLIARFRSDVYLESISTGTIASGAHLGLDSNNKIVKAVDGGGDLTSIDAGTGLSGTSLTGPIPTINIDAAQPTVTSLGTLTALIGGTGDFIWNTNTLVVDTSEAKVGIGTTSPSELLHISSGAATHAKILIDAGADADLILDKGAGSRRSHIDYKIAGTTKWYAGTADSDVVGDGDDYFIGTTVGGSNAEFFLKRSNGYIGSGTIAPSEQLHVRGGNVRIDSDSSGGQNLQFRNNGTANALLSNSYNINSGSKTDFNAYVYGNNPYSIWTNNTNRLSVTGAGNVGIGTTSPASLLHVAGTVQVGADAAGHDVTFFGANSGRDMVWDTSSNALHIKDSAILKIGTGGDLQISHNGSNNVVTNLNGHLEFINYGDNTDIKFTSDNGSGGTTEYLKLDGGYSSPQIIVPDNVALNVGSGLDFNIIHNGSNTTLTNNTGNLTITNNTDDQDIIFQCDDGSGGTTPYLTLDGSTTHSYFSAGNVGIGTTSPSKLLHISQTADSSGIRVTGHDNENNSHLDLYVDNFGNDYITSTEFLGIHSGGSARLRSAGYLRLESVNQNNQIQVDSGYIKMTTSGAEAMRIDTSGNVGIGTTSPGDKLEVDEGFITATGASTSHGFRLERDGLNTYSLRHLDGGFTVYNDTDARKEMSFDGAGNIGIGTNSPASLLHVAGTVQVGVDDRGHDVVFHGATSGKKLTWDESADGLYFADDTYLRLGDGGDVKMWHNGTDSYMMNLVGDLHLLQSANDKDIILSSDDGSGGTTPYLTLDGELGYMVAQKGIKNEDFLWLSDSKYLFVGSGYDLRIHHNGSDSYISQEGTGSLIIRNTTNDEDIIFQCDDGSGGTATYLTLDGSAGYTTAQKHILFEDSVKARFGSGSDLQVYHNGSNSYIEATGTGDLYIQQTTDDKDIIFQSDDGAGGVTTYFQLDGSAGLTTVSKNMKFFDNIPAVFGTGADSYVRHTGSNMEITNTAGNIVIDSATNDGDIIFKGTDGGADITALTLDMSDAGQANFNKSVKLPDLGVLKLGNSSDLQLWHEGGNSFITVKMKQVAYILEITPTTQTSSFNQTTDPVELKHISF